MINPLNARIALRIDVKGDPEDIAQAKREIDMALQVAGYYPTGNAPTAQPSKPQLRVIRGGGDRQ